MRQWGNDAFAVRGCGIQGTGATRCSAAAGTTTRLLAGVCAAYSFSSRFVGDASLAAANGARRGRSAMGEGWLFDDGDGVPDDVTGGRLGHNAREKKREQRAGEELWCWLAGLVSGAPVSVEASARPATIPSDSSRAGRDDA